MACMAARWVTAFRLFNLKLLRLLVARECGMIAQVCQSASTYAVNREIGKTPEEELV